jgi:hypothetical protein
LFAKASRYIVDKVTISPGKGNGRPIDATAEALSIKAHARSSARTG